MNMTKPAALFFGLFLSYSSFSQTKDSSLLVFGDGFSFSVKEPTGWTGDTESANKYAANIIFYKDKADLESGGAIIQILAFTKQDEQTNKDLEADIASYKRDYPKAKLQDLDVKHKEYKCFSKIVYIEKNFYQYIVYVNGGTKYKTELSVALNISKRPATADELKSYLDIIASLTIFAK